MSHDIRDILQRLTAVESKLTPASVKHGLNSQQKSVHQLPALFKPHGIRALGSKTDPQHPMHKELVGDSVETDKTALEEAMQEVEEDMLSKVKKDLTTYLDQLEKKVKVDRDLKDKAVDAIEKGKAESTIDEDPTEEDPVTDFEPAPEINPTMSEQAPVKTITFEDGGSCDIYGDKNRGFEIRSGGKTLPSRFKDIDHASMAVDMYKKHRARAQSNNQDYVDEA
jgi:hypothetical protein